MADLLEQLNEQRRKVDFNTYDITVKELTQMALDKIIDIAPEYQRQFRWEPDRESMFIESVFLGIPVPSLFAAANPNSTWELIDGVQRLSTLIHYIADPKYLSRISRNAPLRLEGLEKLAEFNKLTYAELPDTVQRQFQLKPLKVTLITDKSDMKVRFDLFERLNRGGVQLTAQEIRACLYRGPFNQFLKRLAANLNFKRVVKVKTADQHNGTREELVLRFFAFLYSYKQFGHSVTDFLNDYTSTAAKDFDYEKSEELFKRTFELLGKALPDGITRGKSVTPANLFEAVSVGAALALQLSDSISTAGIKRWMLGPELTALTSGGTNARKKVVERIEFARNKFMGA